MKGYGTQQTFARAHTRMHARTHTHARIHTHTNLHRSTNVLYYSLCLSVLYLRNEI